jgi:hypothetical protein
VLGWQLCGVRSVWPATKGGSPACVAALGQLAIRVQVRPHM